MDEEQLKKLLFFRNFYVFSVNRNEPRKAIASLKYASEHLSQSGTCLFLYPQGAIYPNESSYLHLESGFKRITKLSSSTIHIVPVLTYTETMYHKKPSLWINFSNVVHPTCTVDVVQQRMQVELTQLKSDAHQKNTEQYTSIFL